MLTYEMNGRGVMTYTNDTGAVVGTVTFDGNRNAYLVQASDAYMHGTSTMWWKSLKAAEYHMLAIYCEK
jgi:hypothetical protein